jgi:dipeptidyl-peptidase-4
MSFRRGRGIAGTTNILPDGLGYGRHSCNSFNYDTICTESYMWTPQENKEGYDAGNAMSHVDKLKGRLMIYYGTADNNVHPNNSMQFIQALQRAGKSFEVQAGPDVGRSGIRQDRIMEFFIENLALNGGKPYQTQREGSKWRGIKGAKRI